MTASAPDPAVLDDILRSCLTLLEPLRSVVPTLYKGLQSLTQACKAERLRIGVIGVTSSGKSTFINVLLGEEILPEQSKPTTNVPVLCWQGGERKLTLACHDGRVHEYCNEEVTRAVVEGFCAEDRNPDNVKKVQYINLELPSALTPPQFEVMDTPGTNAHGHRKHEEITLYECVPGSDIIIFMTHMGNPFSEGDLQLLNNILEHDQRLMFVMSHSDKEKDDYERHGRNLSKEQKVRNHVRELKNKLADIPGLKNCGVIAVSSRHAKDANGNRDSAAWRASNFEEVLLHFERLQHELSDETAALEIRAQRALTFIRVLLGRIDAQADGITQRADKTSDLEMLRKEAAKVDAARAAVARHIAKLMAVTCTLLDEKIIVAKEWANFSNLLASDVASFERTLDRVPDRWDARVTELQHAIDTARARCREELDRTGVEAGRTKVKKRALGLDQALSLGQRVARETQTYEVEISRTGLFGPIVEFFAGKKRVTRTRQVSYVDVSGFRADLQRFFQAALAKWGPFAEGQIQMLRDLYLDPLEQTWQTRNGELTELRDIAAAAQAQKEALPAILRGLRACREALQSLCEELAAAQGKVAASAPQQPVSPVEDAALRVLAPGFGPRDLIGSVLARARESTAIGRFWKSAQLVAGEEREIKKIVLLGMDPQQAQRLTGYLTRGRTLPGNWITATPGVSETTLQYRERTTQFVALSRDASLSAPLFLEHCKSADVIGVLFAGSQPGAGLSQLLGLPHYELLREFAGKVLMLFPDGATYDYRLADLVLDVVAMVARCTTFSTSPWYVYEAGRYDARYTDFIEVVHHVGKHQGNAREVPRAWRQRKLSVRPPFHESNLRGAYTEIQDKVSIA